MASTWVVSNHADHGSASDTNGGGYVDNIDNPSSEGYTGTFAQMHDGSGGSVSSVGVSTVTEQNATGNVKLTNAAAYTDSLVGLYTYVDFTAIYTDGWYAVADVDIDGNWIELDGEILSVGEAAFSLLAFFDPDAYLKKLREDSMDYLGHITRKRWELEEEFISRTNIHRRRLKRKYRFLGTIGCRNSKNKATFFLRRKK